MSQSMAATQKILLPPSPEVREELLTAIRSSAQPLEATQIAKLFTGARKLSRADVASILEECLSTGILRQAPPKTPKGKPRYWDRDARELSRAAALQAIRNSQRPLTAREVLRRLVAPLKFKEAELTQFLDEFVSTRVVHAIPAAAAKGKPRYWHRDALEFGRLEILAALEAKGPQAEAQLRKIVKGLSDAEFQQIVQRAVAECQIWRHPPLGKSKKELFGRRPPSPEPYLREIAAQLAAIVSDLAAARVSPDDLRRALVQLVEAAGVRLVAPGVAGRDGAPERPAAVDLIGLMRRIEPGADRGALIGSRDLRRAAQLEKASFDRTVLQLAREGRLSLHRHDFAASLTPAERDELVTDGAGTYYIGMALRQNAG